MRNNLQNVIAHSFNLQNGEFGSAYEVLDSTYTIAANAPAAHFLDAGGVDRDVRLPVFNDGLFFFIINVGTSGNLAVKTAGGTLITTIVPNSGAMVMSGPATWTAFTGGGPSILSGQTFLLRSLGGTATAITALTGASLLSLSQHQMFRFKPIANSTGPTTIEIDGLPAVPLRSPTGGALGIDDIHTGFYYDAVAIGSPVTELDLCRF